MKEASERTENSLEELERTLDKGTISYLNTKYRLSENDGKDRKVDLRVMCENVPKLL